MTPTAEADHRAAEALRDGLAGIVRHHSKPIQLSSGQMSYYYVDAKQVALTAAGHLYIARWLSGLVETCFNSPDPEAIAGVAVGGCSLASATVMGGAWYRHRHWDALYVRQPKQHGLRASVEGNPRLVSNAVLVEDVTTTGRSALDAIGLLAGFNIKTVGVVALVDRGGGQELRRHGYSYTSLTTMAALLERQAHGGGDE